jgi:hypothetical protein
MTPRCFMLTVAWLGAASIAAASGAAAPAASAARERIGIYDSRAVAFAHFWSEGQQRQLQQRVLATKAAEASGDAGCAQAMRSALQADQDRLHLQVFSTEPIDNVFAAMPARVAAVQQSAGVSRLVSKWDAAALERLSGATFIDVTDSLVKDFALPEKQARILRDLAAHEPLPLARARELLRQGQL